MTEPTGAGEAGGTAGGPPRRWIWWARFAVVVMLSGFVVFGTAPPAMAAPPQCYLRSGIPYDPQFDPAPPDSPVGACPADNTSLFGGYGGSIVDANGHDIYDYYFDSGYRGRHRIPNMDTVVMTMVINLIWSLNLLFVWLSCVLLRMALDFTLAKTLIGPVGSIAATYQTQLVDRLGLTTFALSLCIFIFGISAARGKIGKGAGEILLSFVLSAIGGLILAAPASYLLGDEGVLGRTRDFGISIAALPLTDDKLSQECSWERPPAWCDNPELPRPKPGDPTIEDVYLPFQNTLIDTFVRKPHQILAYGTVLDEMPDQPAHECQPLYDKVVDQHDDPEDSPMYQEFEDNCEKHKLHDYMRNNHAARMTGVLFVSIASLLTALYIFVAVVAPMLGGQVAMGAIAVGLVFAIPVSLVGGAARRPLYLLVAGILSTGGVIIASCGSLAFFLAASEALIAYQGSSVLMRMFFIDVIALALLVTHRRFLWSVRHKGRLIMQHIDRREGIGGTGIQDKDPDRAWTDPSGPSGWGWHQRSLQEDAARTGRDIWRAVTLRGPTEGQ